MNASHVAGGGLGAIIGAIIVALGSKIGLNLTNFDSATIGIGALGGGVAIGHAIGEYGLAGIGAIVWRGRPKQAVATKAAVVAASEKAGSTTPIAPPPAV